MALFNITDGPSRWDFMLAIFDGDYLHRREVSFSIEDPKRKPENQHISSSLFIIDEVGRQGESDEKWLFNGLGYYPGTDSDRRIVHGFFSTHTRKGWVEF